ncbi:MAG: tetratricopeptide repeat protein [Planctomycetota bacterium]
MAEPKLGIIIAHREGNYRLREKDGNSVYTWPEDKVERVIRRYTYLEKYTQKLAALPPGDAKARYDLAMWCLHTEVLKDLQPTGEKLNMRPEAIHLLWQAVEIRGDYTDAVFMLGSMLQEDMEFDKALALYADAIPQAGLGKERLLLGVGRCLEALGVTEAAQEYYREAYHTNPRYTPARLAAAGVGIRTGNLEAAVSVIDAAIDRYDVRDAAAFATRGRAKLLLGRLEEARKDLEGALRGDPGNAEAMKDMGVIEVLT